jgi:hypothetical protein
MAMRHAERCAISAMVLLAHVLLLWAWPQPRAPSVFAATEPTTMAVTLLLVPLPPPTPMPRAAEAPSVSQAPERAPRQRRALNTAPSVTTINEPPRVSEALAAVPEPSASSAGPLDLQLRLPRGAAERGGLAEPPNSMRRQALNDPRSNIKPDPTQVLPDAVAASAKGDCGKGEFFGGGGGLLSAPFLAYAVVAGNCKPQR